MRRSAHSKVLLVVAVAAGLAQTKPGVAEPRGAPALAGTSDAARAFAEGQDAFEAGDYRRAASAFEAAYAKKPHHAPLWNAARSWHHAGDDIRAANLLERYLVEAPPQAPDRVPATEALADIKAHVGRVQVRAAPAVSPRLDGAPVGTGTVYVAPGQHVLAGQADGKAVRRAFAVAAGAVVSVDLDPPPRVGAQAEPSRGTRVLPPWTVAIGAGLVLGGIGLTTWSALDTVDKRDTFLDDRTSKDRLDAAFGSQSRTNALITTTVVVGIATAALAVFFVDWRLNAAPARTGSR